MTSTSPGAARSDGPRLAPVPPRRVGQSRLRRSMAAVAMAAAISAAVTVPVALRVGETPAGPTAVTPTTPATATAPTVSPTTVTTVERPPPEVLSRVVDRSAWDENERICGGMGPEPM